MSSFNTLTHSTLTDHVSYRQQDFPLYVLLPTVSRCIQLTVLQIPERNLGYNWLPILDVGTVGTDFIHVYPEEQAPPGR